MMCGPMNVQRVLPVKRFVTVVAMIYKHPREVNRLQVVLKLGGPGSQEHTERALKLLVHLDYILLQLVSVVP